MKNLAVQKLKQDVRVLEEALYTRKQTNTTALIIPYTDVFLNHLDLIKQWIAQRRYTIVIALCGKHYYLNC